MNYRLDFIQGLRKERHLIIIIWDYRVENPVFSIINEVMTSTGLVDLSS